MRKRKVFTRPKLPTNPNGLGRALGRGYRVRRSRHVTQGNSFVVQTSGLRFRVTLTSSRGWKTWRLDRRLYRVTFVDSDESLSQEDHLVLNLACNNALYDLIKNVLSDVQMRHRKAGRPVSALVKLSLNARGLDFPVMSPMTELFHPNVVPDFLDNVMNAFSSHQEISVEDGFELDFTVIDDKDKPNLVYAAGSGKTYCKANMGKFPRPERWQKFGMQSKRFIKVMPNFPGRYQNCCLLAAIVFCMRHNHSQRTSGKDKTFEIMKRINNGLDEGRKKKQQKRREKAAEALREEMDGVVAKHDLNLDAFRVAAIFEPVLATELAKLNVNFVLFLDSVGFKPVMQIPEVYNPQNECVQILLIKIEDNLYHAASILRPQTFNSKYLNVGYYCVHCKKEYSAKYGKFHKCTGVKRNDLCRKCRRVKFGPGMYLDNVVQKNVCIDDAHYEQRCKHCRQMLWSRDCYTAHKTLCHTDTELCNGCGQFYKKSKDKHVCGSKFCRYCGKHVPVEEAAGEGAHFCEMKRPKPQQYYEKMAFFDTETVTEGSDLKHRINAVGLAYERERGVFDEVYFYDGVMDHPEDAKLNEGSFKHNYWPKELESDLERWNPPDRPSMDREKLKKALEAGVSNVGPANDFEEMYGGDGENVMAADFFSSEAAEDSEEDGEGEEEEEEEEEEEAGAGEGRERTRQFLFPTEGEDFGSTDDWEASPSSSAIAKFLDFVLDPKFFNYVFISHAGARFDSVLILRELHARRIQVKPLFDGCKLLQLLVPVLNIRFIDSYRYIKLPLSKFPSRFPKLSNLNLLKGIFPFKFNQPENYEYDGELPGRESFLDEFYSEEAEKKFEKFKESWPPGKTWNYKEQIHAYLKDDVRVLMAGCLELVKELFDFQIDLNQKRDGGSWFHCFSRPYLTKSAFCHHLWIHFEMPPNSLYLLSNQRGARKTSYKERVWLDYEISKGRNIRTAWNQPYGQKQILKSYYPDGIRNVDGKTEVYEFMGCMVHFHGGFEHGNACPYTCKFHPSSKAPFGSTMEQAANAVRKKLKVYREAGIVCHVLWECQFDQMVKEDAELREFIRHHDYPKERLKLRDCLRGGRTEAFNLYFNKTLEPGRAMAYADKNSLYPSVAVFNEFPVGKPIRLIGDALKHLTLTKEDGFMLGGENKVWGAVQAKVLAPKSVYLPLLPYLSGDKLKFPLCAKCVDNMNPKRCKHKDSERALVSTWTSVEIEFAVSQGYKVLKVYEFFVYEKTAPLFKRFYTKLARIKLEAEGFPDEVTTDEEKQAYVDDLNKAMPGLMLKVQNVVKNPGKRAFAKDLSNMGLGKFSQNDLKDNTMYVYSRDQFEKIRLNSPHLKIKSVTPMTDSMAEVTTEMNDLVTGYHRNTQTIVYAFVTAYARIGMAKDMLKLMSLGCRIFYTDTDSIIFDMEDTPEMLASLTKIFSLNSKAYNAYKFETDTPIVSYASLGAKNYSYTTEGGENVVKCRGFTLKAASAAKLINHEVMKELLQGYLGGEVKVVSCPSFKMVVDRKTASIKNSSVNKKYANNLFDKRIVLPETSTACSVPFGLVHYDFSDIDKKLIIPNE